MCGTRGRKGTTLFKEWTTISNTNGIASLVMMERHPEHIPQKKHGPHKLKSAIQIARTRAPYMYHVQYIYTLCTYACVHVCGTWPLCVECVCILNMVFYFILKINFYKFIESFHSFMESMNVHSCLTCIRIHLRSHVHY